MARPSQRKKTRNPASKVTRKTANKHFKKFVVTGNYIIAKNWDKKATLQQNYARIGLMTSLNGVKGGVEKLYPRSVSTTDDTLSQQKVELLRKVLGPNEGIIQRDQDGNVINVIIGRTREEEEEEVFDQVMEPTPAKTDVVKALELQAQNFGKPETHQAEGEKAFARKCIAKYGDDYQAMFRDIKLNTYQHTATQLRKKCEKYLKSLRQSEKMQE
ncbi:hypothetical protein G9A89_004691 [Geosiphon pyriformis]|nr:hypothetical protein G9A89_004691 [Geosiphon pyriformis]